MSWKIRHEGSPVSIDNLTLEQVVEGLQDGQWQPTDEVIGPGEPNWVAIENHPALEETAAEVEPPQPHHHDDETRIDMTALIDVTLVLLIFFILTTSYAALQKLLESADVTVDEKTRVPIKDPKMVKETMIHVKVAMKNNQPEIRVEGRVVDEDDLVAALQAFTTGAKPKREVLIDAEPEVPRQTIITIQDKAQLAKATKLFRLVQKKQ